MPDRQRLARLTELASVFQLKKWEEEIGKDRLESQKVTENPRTQKKFNNRVKNESEKKIKIK